MSPTSGLGVGIFDGWWGFLSLKIRSSKVSKSQSFQIPKFQSIEVSNVRSFKVSKFQISKLSKTHHGSFMFFINLDPILPMFHLVVSGTYRPHIQDFLKSITRIFEIYRSASFPELTECSISQIVRIPSIMLFEVDSFFS